LDTVGPENGHFREEFSFGFFVNPGDFRGTFPAYIEMQCILNKEVNPAVDRFLGERVMFELEKAIREWKRGLRKLEFFQDGAIVELESHLRDEIDRQKGKGLSGAAAFAEAVDLVGRPESLGAEYSKSLAPPMSWTQSWIPVALIGSFFKIAWRKIIRQKGYSFINVAGLEIGRAHV
jgi:hypothetical protein